MLLHLYQLFLQLQKVINPLIHLFSSLGKLFKAVNCQEAEYNQTDRQSKFQSWYTETIHTFSEFIVTN